MNPVRIASAVLVLLTSLSLGLASTARAMNLTVNEAKVITLANPASTVFVAEPKVATYQVVTANKLIVYGAGPGTTSFMVMDEDGEILHSSRIVVAFDTSQMEAALKREFPSLKLKLTAMSDGVVVSGEVPSAQVAADVISLLDSFVATATGAVQSASTSSSSSEDEGPTEMPDDDYTGPGTGRGTVGARMGKVINRLTVTMPTQVVIRVRIAEVSKTVSEKLGVNWFWSSSNTWGGRKFRFGLVDNEVTSSIGTVRGNFGVETAPLPDFAALIDALAGENLISILAEPNLAVTSGQSASFHAGGEMPFQALGREGQVATEFKDYGVSLNVTPTVLSENRISLIVEPSVTDLGEMTTFMQGTAVPSLIKRSASTTIELASGQSFMIGGLLQNNVTNTVNKLPFFGDVPVLGALFRSKEFERQETELVIIATAYVGQPAGNSLRIPNANVVIPNMFNRLFLGMNPDVSSGPIRPDELVYY